MLLDKDKVLEGVRLALNKVDKARKDDQELALLLCLEELSTKLKSSSQLLSYTVTVSGNTREVTLEGDNSDLRYIFALKYGTGELQRVLRPIDSRIFLREYDNPSEAIGVPTKYTQLLSDGGFPKIKFNRPTEATDSLIVYYFPDIDEGNISLARSANAMIDGTLAYFFGKGTQEGQIYYQHFREMIKVARAGDDFIVNYQTRMQMSEDDVNIRGAGKIMFNRRSR